MMLKTFVKEVRLLVPNAERVNRGSYTTKEIVQACKKNEVADSSSYCEKV